MVTKAKFFVDHCFEDDCDVNINERYWFEIELSAKEFEELYQIWFGNNCELNSWDSERRCFPTRRTCWNIAVQTDSR